MPTYRNEIPSLRYHYLLTILSAPRLYYKRDLVHTIVKGATTLWTEKRIPEDSMYAIVLPPPPFNPSERRQDAAEWSIIWSRTEFTSKRHPAGLPLTTAVQKTGGSTLVGRSLRIYDVLPGLLSLAAATCSVLLVLCLQFLIELGIRSLHVGT